MKDEANLEEVIVSKDGEAFAETKKAVSGKVQRQAAKEKCRGGSKAKECLGPFQCSIDECQDSWVKVAGWERKVKIIQTKLHFAGFGSISQNK